MPVAENQDERRPATTPKEVVDLIARFERQLDAYTSGQYNETQLRREFLDPFFKALGWDMDNEQGHAEAYKDVIHEDAIRIGGVVKAPDYCFQIGGTRKFFLEAKKPSVCVKDEPSAAYQLRRYAWSAKLPLSLLSDFEEFAVYDGRVKPHKDDPASVARIFFCTFRELPEKWDWIASIFSREAVLKGSFDKFAESSKAKRGTSEVDAAFLETIESWRLELARNLALRNPNLSQRELNFAVQRIIDRIIFLRIGEDRGLEDYGRLRGLVNGDRIYPRLCQLFEAADARYNSGLFHFKREKDRHEAPDELTLSLALDDKLLRDIFRGLYYPDSPYEFSVLSADILGQVYEQFLGKVIRLTEGHRAVVDDKPEVKKAGGVYYTPTYIVDYIVRQTVGKLLEDICSEPGARCTAASNPPSGHPLPIGRGEGRGEGKQDALSPRAAARILERVSKLRILDPACGSGSFLIGAYQHLLDWHRDFYSANDPARWARGGKPTLYQATGGGWKPTIAERKRILLNNIFGVDIDPQAVEVTKLSLLLKVLEGETAQSLQTVFRFSQERALPDLGDNIKCGNSLIGPDFYQQSELPLLTDEERYRTNVFDWAAEFPQILRRRTSGGELRDTPAAPLDYGMPGVPLHGGYSYKKHKDVKPAPPPAPTEPEWDGGFDAVIGNPPYVNAWELFGSMPAVRGFINTGSTYSTADRHWDLYVLFLERSLQVARLGARISFIIPYSYAIQKYGMASRRMLLEHYEIESVADLRTVRVFGKVPVITMIPVIAKRPSSPRHRIEILGPSVTATKTHPGKIQHSHFVLQKTLSAQPEHMFRIDLATEVEVICGKIESQSVTVGDVCWVNYGAQMSSRVKGKFGKNHVLRDSRSSHTCKKTVSGRDLYRFDVRWDGKWVEWAMAPEMYGARQEPFFDNPKLMIRDITGTHRLELTRDESGLYCDHTILCAQRACDVLAWKQMPPSAVALSREISLDLLLGLLASKVVSAYYYWKLTGEGVRTGGGFHTYPKTIRQLPVFDFRKLSKARFQQVVEIENAARRLLGLHEQLAAARTPQEQTALQRQIAATDTQIDRLVYDLYGLTEDEIKIVEGAAA